MQGRLRLRPWEVLELTVPEIVLALDDDVTRPRHSRTAKAMRHEEVVEHAKRLREMTPKERLDYYRGHST